MKIIIFYASYGGGHLNAAKSINEYILENYKNIDIELIDCMKYINKTIEKVTTSAYNEMAKKAPWAWGKIYVDSQKGPLAHLSSRSNKIMAIKLLKLLREKNADLIISTHPFGSQMCSYLKRKGKIKMNMYFPNWMRSKNFFVRCLKMGYINIALHLGNLLDRKNTLNVDFYYGSQW